MEKHVTHGEVSPQSAVQHAEGRIETADNIELYWQSWCPEQSVGVIVLVHGLADHSGRFESTARFFAAHGWAVYVCDLRGHGLSSDGLKPGRVHVDDFSDYARDVGAIHAFARGRHAGLPCVILGHSMGGLITLAYAIANPELLDGVVVSSPGLGTHPDTRPPAWLNFIAGVLSRFLPRMLFSSGIDSNAVSRDPEVVKAYVADPLVSDKVSARWYTSINKTMADTQARAADLNLPTLIMQSGADTLVDPEATRRWAAMVPAGDIEFVVWDGLYHEMFNEPEKDMVRARVLDWLHKIAVTGKAEVT